MQMPMWFWVIYTLGIITLIKIMKDAIKRGDRNSVRTHTWILVPMCLIMLLNGAIVYLQNDSKRNFKAIEDRFAECDGMVITIRDPILVEACGHKYSVRVKHGQITYFQEIE